jgi:hypothetical protein
MRVRGLEARTELRRSHPAALPSEVKPFMLALARPACLIAFQTVSRDYRLDFVGKINLELSRSKGTNTLPVENLSKLAASFFRDRLN